MLHLEGKSGFKKYHFYAYTNDEIRRAKRPTSVPERVFEDLLEYWNSKEAKDTSKNNKENMKKFKYPHTMGKISFALIGEEKRRKILMLCRIRTSLWLLEGGNLIEYIRTHLKRLQIK
ncbi:uncharacterized protein LOC107845129 [Capsicum annuum]|uniref:uncharacterized protein LOC107845129 n=1 Tax=Capsicum annuum TaxID=4072 RepID=UPI0007BF72F1|nr:uncharacterized protein LOC107845129 [Capsicum annuum]XP_047250282.1 uncharacterized protein LOC107845129 [Capsicum annuum]